jgi:heptosyltransferase-1
VRILLVKMSSMGDVVHNLPLVADILHAHPEAQIDWVVEEAYADLVRLHPGVRRVLPIALRRWRRQLFQPGTLREMRTFWRELRSQSYDAILDTQSLLKSALVCRAARGLRVGYVAAACKEPIAACCYQKRLPYPPVKAVHAVQRYRDLAAWALGYRINTPPHYGLRRPELLATPGWRPSATRYAVLVHSTARASKLWSEQNWQALISALHDQGLSAVLAWGNEAERERAQRLAQYSALAQVVPQKLDLLHWAQILSYAQVVIGLDTGLTYLAAATGVPVVALYCDTAPEQAGVEVDTPHYNLGDIGQPPSSASVLAAVQQCLTLAT